MEYGWDIGLESFRAEVREFARALKTPEVEQELAEADLEGRMNSAAARLVKEGMEERGWLKMCLPREFGGEDRSQWYQFVLQEEIQRAGLPYNGVPWIVPAIEKFGTDDQKKRFLPGIWSGEVRCALGYSEPNAGTDLASLETMATRDGDDWVINGQKLWTSGAHHSTHVWLASRTDPKAPKHRGISMFIIPLNVPGITVRPVFTMSGIRTNEVFFENVRVPGNSLVGEEGRGWYIAANALDVERVSLGGGPAFQVAYDRFLAYLQESRAAILEDTVARTRLADLKVDLHVQRALALTNASIVAAGGMPTMEASMAKVWTTELRHRMTSLEMDLLGPEGVLSKGSEDAVFAGDVEREFRTSPQYRFGGGTNEVQRNIIAQRGLGLPR